MHFIPLAQRIQVYDRKKSMSELRSWTAYEKMEGRKCRITAKLCG